MSTCAIYCRISQDTEGLALGVARQEEDCRRLAERESLAVAAVFVDNDLGASTRSRKARPQYAEMVRRADAGEFGWVLAYSNSRLTRRPMELEDLISLHERTGTRFSTVVSGNDDLSAADGRMVARIKASVDAAEAERTAERVARKHLENARTGKPVGGTRPFGWDDDKATIRPAEAALIRKAAHDVIAGVPLRGVAREWEASGIVSPRGAPWSSQTIRAMLKSPRLAGWRVHRGAIALGNDGQAVRGQWAAILDQGTHDRLLRVMSSPETRSRVPRRGARHYLLTGVVRCGVCNGPMYGNRYGPGRHYYTCHDTGGHTLSVSGHGTDEVIAELVLARLAKVDLDAPAPSFGGESRLGEIAEQVAELMGAFVANKLTAAAVFPAVERLESEQAVLTKQRTVIEASTAGPKVGRIDRASWDVMDTDRRRAVVELVLDAVLIRPATTRGNQLDVSRIVPVWKEVRG